MDTENSIEKTSVSEVAIATSAIINTILDPKENRKREKDRKKGEKKTESFMKSIASHTTEEKVDVLCKKYSEAIEETRNLKGSINVLQRKILVIEKEKEQLQNEQSKSVLARSRLEALCRELQRQNKSIKDESLQKIREEEEKRKEVSSRFQVALNEVSQMMQQNTDKNLKLRDDNIEISNKFQKLCDQFKQREEEVIRLTREMELEKQLAQATLNRTECQLKAERAIWSKEKEAFLAQLKFHQEEKQKLEQNIKSLEEHLAMYSTKYEEFESIISKSNQVFDDYKTEMNGMSKQITKCEQENTIWKERWMQSQQIINRITNDHRNCEQNIQEREKKVKNLAELCRSIQEERAAYLKQLKDNGLVPVVVEKKSALVVEPAQNTSRSSHKLTKKEKELALLKKEMKSVETQLVDSLKTTIKQREQQEKISNSGKNNENITNQPEDKSKIDKNENNQSLELDTKTIEKITEDSAIIDKIHQNFVTTAEKPENISAEFTDLEKSETVNTESMISEKSCVSAPISESVVSDNSAKPIIGPENISQKNEALNSAEKKSPSSKKNVSVSQIQNPLKSSAKFSVSDGTIKKKKPIDSNKINKSPSEVAVAEKKNFNVISPENAQKSPLKSTVPENFAKESDRTDSEKFKKSILNSSTNEITICDTKFEKNQV